MKATRHRVPVEQIERESRWVRQFALNHLVLSEGARAPIGIVFACYKSWLKRNYCGPSELSVDGFGRLLPKTYKRGAAWINGESRKCVLDVRVRT